MARSKLHRERHHPYYIHAPAYSYRSAGIRVLHYLAHALRLLGEEAYLVTEQLNPRLNTALLTPELREQHAAAELKPIVIYPEVVHGNPENSDLVVRYLLNRPGIVGGADDINPEEILYAYKKEFLPPGIEAPQLFTPTSDLSLFQPPPAHTRRTGSLFFVSRAKPKLLTLDLLNQHPADALEVSHDHPRSPEELAKLFKSAEVLYAYEPSATCTEAMLCGCPVVYIPNPFYADIPNQEIFGTLGTALLGDAEGWQRAKETVNQAFEIFQAREKVFWQQLRRFVRHTQKIACRHVAQRGIRANTIAANENQAAKDYALWRTRKSLQEIDGQLLAERMMRDWTSRPLFNIVLEVRAGEENLLADTLDHLGPQWYGDWHLTIFAEFPPFSDDLAQIPQVTWHTVPAGGFVDAFNHCLADLPGDWLLLLETGCQLEAHALAYFADTLNLAGMPRLIYCDEDQLTASGEFANPRFKPALNREMLRSMYYLGPCLAVEKRSLAGCGGLQWAGSAGYYDIALKFCELYGQRGMVHLPEILVHTSHAMLRELPVDDEHAALHAHFARQGIAAQLEPGVLQGTQAITYPPQGNPQVSIIIPTRDQPGYLQHCVDSLLSETDYKNFELILVDHDTTDPDALDLICGWLERGDLADRMRCIRSDGEFNWARLANLGASEARGDYLLFLDNDTEIIQPAWLSRLLGLVQQQDVVAVAPRLSCPDGKFSKINQLPRLLGIAGLTAPLGEEGKGLLEPGYCGRLQISQEMSALSGSCLLVQRNAFLQAGKFDEINTPLQESVTDLSLRLGQAGGKLIWTPWVDVIHHGGISRRRALNDAPERNRQSESLLAEQDYLLRQHLPTLANDPNYHRQLSLLTPFAIEPHAVVDWDTRVHDRLRVLGVPLTSGSGEYRMTAPFRALQRAGLAQCCLVHPISKKVSRVINPIELARAAPDVLMLQQAIDDTQISQLKRYRQYNRNIFITYAVDDAMGNLPRKHYLYNYQAREGKSRMREGLAYCDRLIVSTEPLADYCRNMIDDIVVVPNRLEKERWLGLNPQRRTSKKPRVGWAGAQQHLGDLELICQVVEALKDEVDWVFMGMCPDFLKPHIREEHAFVAFNHYPAKLASLNLDLAIAPLEQHLFNEGKSNLRLLEYGIMGWPVVCTDIYPYQTNHAPVKRVNNVASEWIAAIRERIYDLDATAREGDRLRDWVLTHYLLEDHLPQWVTAVTPAR